MATTHLKTYDAVGIKEDVADVISNISPTKTPFQTMVGSEKCNNTVFQWQEDELAAVRDNAQVEGFEPTDASLAPTVMRDNNTQILEKTFKVSNTADAVSMYGRDKETAYQMVKAGKELKRDLEHSFVGTAQAKSAGDSATARKMAGYQAMVDASLTFDNAGTGRDLTESLILEADQALYDAGSEGSILMVKPADSLKIADFANAAGRSRDVAQDKKITNVVNIYVSPFGEKKVVMNRFLKSTDALIFDPSEWKKVTLRNWTRETLAKTGDNTRHMMVGEFSLKHSNFKSSALITDLN